MELGENEGTDQTKKRIRTVQLLDPKRRLAPGATSGACTGEISSGGSEAGPGISVAGVSFGVGFSGWGSRSAGSVVIVSRCSEVTGPLVVESSVLFSIFLDTGASLSGM
jgi:hypothetical protein